MQRHSLRVLASVLSLTASPRPPSPLASLISERCHSGPGQGGRGLNGRTRVDEGDVSEEAVEFLKVNVEMTSRGRWR